MKYLFILLGLTSPIKANANVLQEKKQADNKSNVDDFIQGSSNQFDKMSRRFDVAKTHSQGSFKKAFAGNTEKNQEKTAGTIDILEEVLGKFTTERISPIIDESKNINLTSTESKQSDNKSNVDAIIQVPTNQFDKNMYRRRYVPKTHSQGSFKKAVAGNTENKREKKADTIENLEEVIRKFTNERMAPIFRSESKNLKPEIIHFRNEKPSVMYEIKTNTLLKIMKEILASEHVEKFVDNVARKAGVVFRSSMRRRYDDV